MASRRLFMLYTLYFILYIVVASRRLGPLVTGIALLGLECANEEERIADEVGAARQIVLYIIQIVLYIILYYIYC